MQNNPCQGQGRDIWRQRKSLMCLYICSHDLTNRISETRVIARFAIISEVFCDVGIATFSSPVDADFFVTGIAPNFAGVFSCADLLVGPCHCLKRSGEC